MTETLSRPAVRRTRPSTPPPRSPLPAGLTAAAWAAGAGLVALALPVLLVWATDARSGSGAGAALRAVGQVWLLAHQVSFEVPGGELGLAPLGLAVVPLLLLARAGAHTARECRVRTPREAAVLVAAVAGPYAVLAAVVAGASRSAAVTPSSVEALAAGLLLGAFGAGTGVVRAAGLRARLLRTVPVEVRLLATAATAAVGVLLAGGALLVGASLVLHLGQVQELAGATAPGAVGGAALLVLGLATVPNAVVWGAAWLAGPGVAVGEGTAVSPFAAELGAVPAYPLLGALPSSAPPTWLGVLVLAVPLGAGALAGAVVVRRSRVPGVLRAAGEAALTGPCAGVLALLLAVAAGGPLGGGRLAAVGPSWWQVGLAVTAEVAVGAAACAAVVRWRRRR